MNQNDPAPGLVVPAGMGTATPAPTLRSPGMDMGLDAQVFNRLLRERIPEAGVAMPMPAGTTSPGTGSFWFTGVLPRRSEGAARPASRGVRPAGCACDRP